MSGVVFLLFFLLLILDIIYFVLFDRDILSPSVLAVSMFAFSTFIAILNINEWKFALSAYTVVMIMLSLSLVGLGEVTVRLSLPYKSRRSLACPLSHKEPISVNSLFCIFISVLIILFFVHHIHELTKLAIAAGYKKNQGLLLVAYIRKARLHPELYGHADRISGYSSMISNVFAFVFLYIILYNKIFFNKINVFYFFPFIAYLPFNVFSGGRTSFIMIIAFCIVVGGTFYLQKNKWGMKATFNVLRIGFVGIICFFVIFVYVGSLKHSTITKHAWHTISFYTGMSIPSLDDYFIHPRPKGELFGQYTLTGLYTFLMKFDKTIPKNIGSYHHLDFVSFNGTVGNIYTAIRPYHQDFGVFGMCFMMFFFGFFYTMFYIIASQKNGLGMLLYGYMVYPLVMISMNEQFLSSRISTGCIETILLYCIVYTLLCNRNFKRSLVVVIK